MVRNNFIQNNIKVNAFSKVSEKVHICFTLGRDTTYSAAAAARCSLPPSAGWRRIRRSGGGRAWYFRGTDIP